MSRGVAWAGRGAGRDQKRHGVKGRGVATAGARPDLPPVNQESERVPKEEAEPAARGGRGLA